MEYLGIILILSLFYSIYLALMITLEIEEHRYDKYIIHSIKFFHKDKPEITCQILDIYKDFINPRLRIKVMYPTGNTCKLITTMKIFEEYWIEIPK